MNRSAFFAGLYPANTKLLVVTAQRGPKTREEPKGSFTAKSAELVEAGELDGRVWDDHLEVFFAPMPMRRVAPKLMPRSVDASSRGRVVWCDADGGLMPNTYKWLADDIGACLVESGGVTEDGRPKYHVYIKLDRSTPDFQIEALNKGLAKKIDQLNGDARPGHRADPSKCHRASLLRVPGTFNHKHRDECPMGCYDGHEGVTA